jgi:hypothetical protein
VVKFGDFLELGVEKFDRLCPINQMSNRREKEFVDLWSVADHRLTKVFSEQQLPRRIFVGTNFSHDANLEEIRSYHGINFVCDRTHSRELQPVA